MMFVREMRVYYTYARCDDQTSKDMLLALKRIYSIFHVFRLLVTNKLPRLMAWPTNNILVSFWNNCDKPGVASVAIRNRLDSTGLESLWGQIFL